MYKYHLGKQSRREYDNLNSLSVNENLAKIADQAPKGYFFVGVIKE